MTKLGEKTLFGLIVDTESMRTLEAEDLPSEVIPDEELRSIYEWALRYFRDGGRIAAPTIEVLKETDTPGESETPGQKMPTMYQTLLDNDVSLNELPDETIGWVVQDLKASYINRRMQEWTRESVQEIMAALPEDKHKVLAKISTGLTKITADLDPARSSGDHLFHEWTIEELLAEPDEFEWLIQGWLTSPTYGMLAGQAKALKSYLLQFMQVAVAAGVPLFGQFAVPQARPVVAYVGEGGRREWLRRLRRIAYAMGVEVKDLDIHPRFDVAPIGSDRFNGSLYRDLAQHEQPFVGLDALYSYHGGDVRSSDLHQEGDLLNQVSAPCMHAGATLLINNHFKKTGSGMSLSQITQAGGSEWSDSWVLSQHQNDPTPEDVEAGQFHLSLDIGSRQWGGRSWELDLNIGRFDEETAAHDGDISWEIHKSGTERRNGKRQRQEDLKEGIVNLLDAKPFELTKTEIYEFFRGNKVTFEESWRSLLMTEGLIEVRKIARKEQNRTITRDLWGKKSNHSPSRGDGFLLSVVGNQS